MAVKSKPYQLEWKGSDKDDIAAINKRMTETIYRINSMLDTLFKGVTNTETDAAAAADAIALPDTDASHTLGVVAGSNLTDDRTLTLTTGDANRTLTLTGDASISGTHTGTSSGTNTGDQTNISGNAATATALQTARTINGTSFNGTANITVTVDAALLGGTTLAANVTSSSLTQLGTITNLNVTSADIDNLEINNDIQTWGRIKFINSNHLIRRLGSSLDYAGFGAGTLSNAPTAGNPTKWISIEDDGTTRYIPTWT